ncbi:uncharacterized protein LOC120263162 [Dioscorea cayenensis subsp. rotundata]|uniref:Uncharacterized protein LOC120263162 n=1 Tax=Dioscorea cayennensis subsp. rotundata TaxID=55577 RepID=A0AB40BHW3_DIOCR|nr:uncharacterized protein LOC120263162 [Dioscorea cayenensis subsp. rotundata]
MDSLNLWRKKDEEDDLLMLSYWSRECSATSRNVEHHPSILTGAAYVQEILEGHEERCKREFRMEPYIFQALVDHLREKSLLCNSKRTIVKEQLPMFMYTLAHNASNRDVQERFQYSAETVSRYFSKVLKAVNRLAHKYVEPPSTMTSPVIQNTRKFSHNSRNKKQTLSQNVMVACDFDLHFVYVRAGWKGFASDARILQRSIEQGFEVSKGKYYLVDAGYANILNFIAPYRGVRYHLQEQGRAQSRPSNYKGLFNLLHASLKNHVERIIGILKMRFPILKVATYHPIDSQTGIVVAACMLHNFIRIHNGTEVVEDFDSEAEETIVPNGDESYGEDVDTMNSERNTAIAEVDHRFVVIIKLFLRHCIAELFRINEINGKESESLDVECLS